MKNKGYRTAALSALLAALISLCGCEKSPGADEAESPTAAEKVSETEPPAASSAATQTTTETTAETTTETTTALPPLEFEDTPENAFERLERSFAVEGGGEMAPDDYAGAYSYAGTLFVAITSDEPSEYYTSLLGGYSCVRYRTVEHSLAELTLVAERAAELLDDNFGVEEYFIDVVSNKAAVTITSGDPRAAQDHLKSIGDIGFELGVLEISMAQ